MRPAEVWARSSSFLNCSVASSNRSALAIRRRTPFSFGGANWPRSTLLQLLASCSARMQNSRSPKRNSCRRSLMNAPNIHCSFWFGWFACCGNQIPQGPSMWVGLRNEKRGHSWRPYALPPPTGECPMGAADPVGAGGAQFTPKTSRAHWKGVTPTGIAQRAQQWNRDPLPPRRRWGPPAGGCPRDIPSPRTRRIVYRPLAARP